MLRASRMIGRLFRAARVLAAHDVLPPPEWNAFVPVPARLAARLLPRARDASMGRSGERLARALTRLGPSYIKAGQFLATRPDVIGQEMAGDLASLQDRLPPFPTETARAILTRELPPATLERLEDIGDAIAAASIAQVHKVRLKPAAEGDAPRTLALKILRPDIEQDFGDELSGFAWAARHAEDMSAEMRRLKPVALVETLARSVTLEMDLRLEAAAAAELATNTSGDPGFRVPAVDWDFTTKHVLATEWIDGTPLRDIECLKARGHDPKKLATTVIQSFLRQALRDGFFHADMHPGNLFVDHDGRLVAVDFGIMGRLDMTARRFMAETLAGFLARDYRRIAEIHLQIGFVPPQHSIEDFAQALRAIGEPIFGRPASNMSMARLLTQLFEVTRLFDMQMQPQLVMLQKTMVVVEGVARQLDPEHSIWEAARPVVEKWMIDSIGPQARLREAAAGMSAMGTALAALPEALRRAEQVTTQLSREGLRLHPDSAAMIAGHRKSGHTVGQVALWIGLLALAAWAGSIFI